MADGHPDSRSSLLPSLLYHEAQADRRVSEAQLEADSHRRDSRQRRIDRMRALREVLPELIQERVSGALEAESVDPQAEVSDATSSASQSLIESAVGDVVSAVLPALEEAARKE